MAEDFPQQMLNTGIPAGLLDGKGVPVSPWATTPASQVNDPNVDPRDVLMAQVTRAIPSALSGPIRSSAREAEKYIGQDFGFMPSSVRDNEDFYAQYQSGMEKIGKGLAKLPLYTITKLGSSVGFIAGIANPVNWFAEEGYISSVADNSISGFFDGWEQDIKNKWLPTFQEAEDREKGFFARAATDIDFWTEDLVDGVAFMASAWVPGLALSKVGAGAKAINALAKLGTTAVESVGGTIEAVAASTNYFKNAAKYAQNLDKFNAWAIATSSEAMFEAKGVKDSIMESLEGSSYTDAQKKQIAGDNARNTFLMNAALLGVTNIFELPLVSKMLNKTDGVASRIMGGAKFGEDIAVKQATTQVGKFLETGYGRFAKDVTKGIFREGFIEENGQLAIQRFNEQYGAQGKVTDMLDFDTYSELGGDYLKQTYGALSGEDNEASTSIGLGGILGGGMTSLGNARQAPKNKLTTEQAVDYYNKAQQSWLKFGNIYQTEQVTTKDANGNDVVNEKIKLDKDNQPIMDKDKLAGVVSSVRSNAAAINLTDNDSNITRKNIVRDNAFADFVIAHINAGVEDSVVQKLDATAKSSPEELAKLGFVADNTLPDQIARYKTLAANIIKQNKIINADIIFDGSKEDKARKARLTELAAQQAIYRGLNVEQLSKYNEIKNEAINSENSSLTDGLVDQLNNLLLRIKSQEQFIKELKAQPQGLTKSKMKIANSILDNLKDQLKDLNTNNETSVKGLKTFNNGLYQYEKEARNDGAFLNPMIKKLKFKGELENQIQALGQEWGMYADFTDGKKNFLDMFIDQQIKEPINQTIEEENQKPPAVPPVDPKDPKNPPANNQKSPEALDEKVSYSYEGQVYNIMVLGDSVIMLNVKSDKQEDSIAITDQEFRKGLADGKISAVTPLVEPKIENIVPAPAKEKLPDNLEDYLLQEYERIKTALKGTGQKLLSYPDWKRTAGVAATKRWMAEKGQQQPAPAVEGTNLQNMGQAGASIGNALVDKLIEEIEKGSYFSSKKEVVDELLEDARLKDYEAVQTSKEFGKNTVQGYTIVKKKTAPVITDTAKADIEGVKPVEETTPAEDQTSASTLEKELNDLVNQLSKDLGPATQLRFRKVGTIGYDKEGNKYEILSRKDKYGRSLEYRKNDSAEQSFNPLTASEYNNDLGYYPEAFVKLYNKNPKVIIDQYQKDKVAIEEKYAQMEANQTKVTTETEQLPEQEDTSKDVKDYAQDINKLRTQSTQDSKLANAEYQEGYRQVAPSNSLANATDLVNIIEFSPGQIRYERGKVNKKYVFDVATSTFMPGSAVSFKVVTTGLGDIVNRLTGEVYDKDAIFDKNNKVKQDMFDFVPIAVFANVNGKEVQIGTIHEPQWIEYMIGEKYPHIAIPEDQLDQKIPDVVIQETKKNRELRQQILENYNKNPTFVMQGIVEDKSMGIIRTTESVDLLSKRVNPRIAEGGSDNRHGMFAIVKDGMIQADRNVEVENIIPTESFSPQKIADYQGIALLMLPTPTGKWFPSFIKLPNVSIEQSEFIIEAWKAFTAQTNNPEIIKAVYDAMGLTQSSDSFGLGVLRDYIHHYITIVDEKGISRTGTGTDLSVGSARLNITNNGGLELQVKGLDRSWYSTAEPIMKAENLPVDYLQKMTNLKTTIRFSSAKNDSLKGINSTDKATILSIKNGKLVKESMTYNQYIMNRAGTFVDAGIPSKNPFNDWVYFANPVLKMKVTNTIAPNEGQTASKEDTSAPSIEQVNTPREDKGAALLAALKSKKLEKEQIEEQKNNCSNLRSKLANIM
jgi:anti-sigma28 factor (negative regulator of flagellin synthesis)